MGKKWGQSFLHTSVPGRHYCHSFSPRQSLLSLFPSRQALLSLLPSQAGITVIPSVPGMHYCHSFKSLTDITVAISVPDSCDFNNSNLAVARNVSILAITLAASVKNYLLNFLWFIVLFYSRNLLEQIKIKLLPASQHIITNVKK